MTSIHSPPRGLRVCHLMSGDLWGGAEAQVIVLLGALKTSDLDLSAVLLNEGRVAEEVRSLGIPLEVISEAQYSFPSLFKRLSAHLSKHPPEILHSHRYKENALAAMAKRAIKVPKLVQTVHGFSMAHPGRRSAKEALVTFLDHRVAARAFDHVISVSEDIAGRLNPYFPQDRISVIHNGVDATRLGFDLGTSDLREELGLSPTDPLIGVAGRMVAVKAFDVFLRCLPRVLSAFPEAHAVLVGDGPLLGDLVKLTERMGLSGQVHFTGFRTDIAGILASLDLFVISSRHEGIPMVLLEAMALARPVIATRVGGLPEVLKEDSYGRLVPPDDPGALAHEAITLLGDPALRQAIGTAARLRVQEEFSSEIMGRRVAEVYRTLSPSP